jgi:hypothetical protein
MSTFVTSTRPGITGATITRRGAPTSMILPQDIPPSTGDQVFSVIQVDTVAPTPSTTTRDPSDNIPSAATSSIESSTTCSIDSNCTSDKICSNGKCASTLEASPFGPGGSSNLQPTTRMSAGAAIGVSIGVVVLVLLLVGLGFMFWKRKTRRPLKETIETPPPNRIRPASNATDQNTLVASLPNSPQNEAFRTQQVQMSPERFEKISDLDDGLNQSETGDEKAAPERQPSLSNATVQKKALPLPPTDMPLPLPPTDMPLPPPPTEEKRYAINVNINKSMIFDDIMFNSTSPAHGRERSKEGLPKYRFEEYVPPIVKTPQLSISKEPSSRQTSAYELDSYLHDDGSSALDASTDDEESAEVRSRRRKTLKKLESDPPRLPPPELPPPSPSFSFNSYDWYQDIIGPEHSNIDDPTPSLLNLDPARTPTQATFGAALSSNPPDADLNLIPDPLLPSRASSLSKTSRRSAGPPVLPSPALSGFRLSPTVYDMPSRLSRAVPIRTPLQSANTQGTSRTSRSWLPDDGRYLLDDKSLYSHMNDKRRLSGSGRPTSYSPLT